VLSVLLWTKAVLALSRQHSSYVVFDWDDRRLYPKKTRKAGSKEGNRGRNSYRLTSEGALQSSQGLLLMWK
jgi:hypothetical protein